jgi:hypothetical protein
MLELHRRVGEEFEGLRLGDKRLESRVRRLVQDLSANPRASILKAAPTTAAAEASYRLIRNRRVSMPAMLKPHITHTAERCRAVEKVLVLHDTSIFEFGGGERKGLGRVRTKSSQGFLFHASFAVEAGTRCPLGLVASKVWTRDEVRTGKTQGKKGLRKTSGSDYARMEKKESDRWGEQIQSSSQCLAGCAKVIHVADREADIYALLAQLKASGESFVIRLSRDKKARAEPDSELESLIEIATRAKGCAEVDVAISARRATALPRQSKTFGMREARSARLEFAAATAEIRAPRYVSKEHPGSLPMHVVHVRELDAPSENDAIEWLLLTSEPVDTEAQVREVVEIYRARWTIEEFFKALKTGCAMEERELESLHTLTNVLALCIPIAHHLLAVRHLARSHPTAPADLVLTRAQIAILQAKARLPQSPTAHQALVAIAYMGSHFVPFERRQPGWQVLALGMQRLLAFEEGWLAHAAEDPIKR